MIREYLDANNNAQLLVESTCVTLVNYWLHIGGGSSLFSGSFQWFWLVLKKDDPLGGIVMYFFFLFAPIVALVGIWNLIVKQKKLYAKDFVTSDAVQSSNQDILKDNIFIKKILLMYNTVALGIFLIIIILTYSGYYIHN